MCKINKQDFPGGPVVKKLPTNARYTSLIPAPGRFHMLQSNYAWAHSYWAHATETTPQQEKPQQWEACTL